MPYSTTDRAKNKKAATDAAQLKIWDTLAKDAQKKAKKLAECQTKADLLVSKYRDADGVLDFSILPPTIKKKFMTLMFGSRRRKNLLTP